MIGIYTFPLRPVGPKLGNVSSKRFEPQSGSTRLLHICNMNMNVIPMDEDDPMNQSER